MISTTILVVDDANGQEAHFPPWILASPNVGGDIEILELLCESGNVTHGIGLISGTANFMGQKVSAPQSTSVGAFVGSSGVDDQEWVYHFGPVGNQEFYLTGISQHNTSGYLVVTGYSSDGIADGDFLFDEGGMFRLVLDLNGNLVGIFPANETGNENVWPSSVEMGNVFFGHFSGNWIVGDSTHTGVVDIHGGGTPFIGVANPLGEFESVVPMHVARGSFAGELEVNADGDVFFTAILSSSANIKGKPFEGAQPSRNFLQGIGKLSADLNPIWLLAIGSEAWIDGQISTRGDGGLYFSGSFTGPVDYGQDDVGSAGDMRRSYIGSISKVGNVEWVIALDDDFVHFQDLSTTSNDEAVVSIITSHSISVQNSGFEIPVSGSNTLINIRISTDGMLAGYQEVGTPLILNTSKSLSCGSPEQNITLGTFRDSASVFDTTLRTSGGTGSFIGSESFINVGSEELTVSQAPPHTDFSLFPNPAESTVHIKLNSYLTQSSYSVFVHDLLGRLISHRHESFADRFARIQIDVSVLGSGNYFVSVVDNNGKRHTEMVVVR